ncbi:MAG: SDR family NAD(P)-dependent oxidoreductase [Candidatus Izemoplasmatales bacterium]
MNWVLVTGATSGIGYEICKACLEDQFEIIGIGRNKEKIIEVENELTGLYPGRRIVFFQANLSELDETEVLSKQIVDFLQKENQGKLFGLVNNVGCVKSWYETNRLGYELQFSTNHLSSYVLTHNLLPSLILGHGRILFTSSKSHKMMKINWKDMMYERKYHPLLAYKQSKLCNLLFAHEINNRFAHLGVKAYGIDPGLVKTDIGNKNTKGLVDFVWRIRKNGGVHPSVPAKTFAWILRQNSHPEGFYYYNLKVRSFSKEVNDINSTKLIEYSDQLCKIKFGGNVQ